MPILAISLALLAQGPERAQAGIPPPAAQSGKVVLRCVADYRTKAVRDCRVLSEEPAGQGFGEAALELTVRMKPRLPDRGANGETSRTIDIPMTFKLAE